MTANQRVLVFYPPSIARLDYTIPETIAIDSYAFQDSVQLQSLTVPETVKR